MKVLGIQAMHMISGLMVDSRLNNDIQRRNIDSFRREYKSLQLLRHPNVVQYLTFCNYPCGNFPMIVMELLDSSLERYLTHSSPKILIQISLSRDVASALEYLHQKNIIHRDLCGSNILLQERIPTPVAKVSDFGLSKIIDGNDDSWSTLVMCRKAYIPPEIREDPKSYDLRIDIFMLGVVILQIAHGIHCIKDREHRSDLIRNTPSEHPLKTVIIECVKAKELRPKAAKIAEIMKDIIANNNTNDDQLAEATKRLQVNESDSDSGDSFHSCVSDL